MPTRTWLAATRAITPPGRMSSRSTRSPVVTMASARVVGHAQRRHRLAAEVLRDHREQRGAAVAHARERASCQRP
ncbi:MAG: hypothetical protein U5L08_06570 [Xanthomonadales bacterium]|nr:hypothetical protein [Xanthomonadales bacterium]